jgi:hypothetical protein
MAKRFPPSRETEGNPVRALEPLNTLAAMATSAMNATTHSNNSAILRGEFWKFPVTSFPVRP